MSKTENPPLNKRTEQAWTMLKSLFEICTIGVRALCCLSLLEEVQVGSPVVVRSCNLHSPPPDQELGRQRATEWKKLLPVLKAHSFSQQQPGSEAHKV